MKYTTDGPAIPYGKNIYGELVAPREAERFEYYSCPYCREELNFRAGEVRLPYFAHHRIVGRTPQQMLCPGYRGGNKYNNRSVDAIDRLYVANGGMPLYLCKGKGQDFCILSSKFPCFERLKFPMFIKGIPLFERD